MRVGKRSRCPVACTLDILGDKWTLLVIRDLAHGKSLFKEFCASPEGIATNILAERLQRLVAHGLVERFPLAEKPEREAYRLSAKGTTLLPILTAVAEWGLLHIPGTEARLKPR
jgi:DNA-binding HxlR family transcriptional regulator